MATSAEPIRALRERERPGGDFDQFGSPLRGTRPFHQRHPYLSPPQRVTTSATARFSHQPLDLALNFDLSLATAGPVRDPGAPEPPRRGLVSKFIPHARPASAPPRGGLRGRGHLHRRGGPGNPPDRVKACSNQARPRMARFEASSDPAHPRARGRACLHLLTGPEPKLVIAVALAVRPARAPGYAVHSAIVRPSPSPTRSSSMQIYSKQRCYRGAVNPGGGDAYGIKGPPCRVAR